MCFHMKHAARFLFLTVVSVGAIHCAARAQSIKLANVRSGRAHLRQEGRLTILEIVTPSGKVQSVALTHPSNYLESRYTPFEARLIAESMGHFLIFTDSFVSNPGNIQGMCGASLTGERFVHVVALGAIPHETLSVLVDSCLQMFEAEPGSPEWIAQRDQAGFAGRLVISSSSGGDPPTTATYYIAPDGAATSPDIKAGQEK